MLGSCRFSPPLEDLRVFLFIPGYCSIEHHLDFSSRVCLFSLCAPVSLKVIS